MRPSDIKQQLDVCIIVSDDRQEFDDDSHNLTSANNVEMSRLNSSNERCVCTACGDVPVTQVNDSVRPGADNTAQNRAAHGHGNRVRVIILDCCRVTFIDSMAVAALKKISSAYHNVGIRLVLSGCDAKVTPVIAAACLLGDSETHIEIYPTVHDAVVAVG